jgi:hypothetical protein
MEQPAETQAIGRPGEVRRFGSYGSVSRGLAKTAWGNSFPRAVASGTLQVGPIMLPCAVLDDGIRVLTQVAFLHALAFGRSRTPRAGTRLTADWVPTFLGAGNLTAYIDDTVLRYSTPVRFRTELGTLERGYDARLLPAVCLVYLHARENNVLSPGQLRIAQRASVFHDALSEDGIVSMVDESTGFREHQARKALTATLTKHIAPELLFWTKRFPDEFFTQVYRLERCPSRPGVTKRAPTIARWAYSYVFDQLPAEVLDHLRAGEQASTDRWRRGFGHHGLEEVDTGNQHLDNQIGLVIVLMRISKTKDEFERLFTSAFDAPPFTARTARDRYEGRPLGA